VTAHALSGPIGLLAKLGGTWMERQENVQEAMKKTPEELVLWAIGANDNPLRLNIAKLEFEHGELPSRRLKLQNQRSRARSGCSGLSSCFC